MRNLILFTFITILLFSCNTEIKTENQVTKEKPLNVVYIMADDHALSSH